MFRHRIIDSRSSCFYSREGRACFPSRSRSLRFSFSATLAPRCLPLTLLFPFYRSLVPSRVPKVGHRAPSDGPSDIPISKRPRAAHMDPGGFLRVGEQAGFRFPYSLYIGLPRPLHAGTFLRIPNIDERRRSRSISISRAPSHRFPVPAHNRQRGKRGDENRLGGRPQSRGVVVNSRGAMASDKFCGASRWYTLRKFGTYLEAVGPALLLHRSRYHRPVDDGYTCTRVNSDKISRNSTGAKVTFLFLRFHAVRGAE